MLFLRGLGAGGQLRRALRPLPGRRWLHSASVVDSSAVGLSAETLQFKEVAERFSASELAPFADEWDRTCEFPEATLRRAAELGFGGVFVRGEHGGSELGRLDGSVIFEALAAGCPSTTAYLTIHNMCAWMVDSFGSDELRARLLPSLCSMEKFSSYCLTEPGSGSDASSLSTSAELDAAGTHYVLNGSKAFISGGGSSDVYLVMARTGGAGPSGISCLAVDGDAPGLSFGAQERKLGWHSQPTCQIFFEDCRVPAGNLVGLPGQGFKIAMAGLDGGRLSIGTCSVGAARRCLDLTRHYVQGREQFGAPLSANQSVQFKLADMAAQVHSSRLMIRSAAKMLDDGDPNASAFCAMAKKFATDASFETCNSALQLHGGYGYLQGGDSPERFLRDVRVHQILEGTNEIMQHIVGRAVLRATDATK